MKLKIKKNDKNITKAEFNISNIPNNFDIFKKNSFNNNIKSF